MVSAVSIPNSASKRGIKELAHSQSLDTNASKKLKMAAAKRSAPSAKTAKSGAGMDAANINVLANNQAYHRGMFLAFIDNAFAERRMGRNEHYNELVSQFKAFSSGPAASTSAQTASQSAAPSMAQLRSWMEALTHVVAQLDRSHSVLVDAVVSLPWTSMEEPIAYAYTRFVQALLCSRSEFVQMTIEKIIKGFRFHSGNATTEDGRSNASAVTRRQSYERLHQLLSSLIYLIPTLPTALWPIVNRHFPHKRENRNAQVVYITNALRIVEYCPQLGENVLGAVILQAIQIDVEIQIDIDDLEDEEGALDEEVFGYSVDNPFDRLVGDEDSDSDSEDEEGKDLDVDAISSDGDSENEGDDTDDNKDELDNQNKEKVLSPAALKRLKDMAAKLDAILRVVFDFLKRIDTVSSAKPSRNPLTDTSSFLPRDALVTALNSSSTEADTTRLDQRTGSMLRHTIFDVLLAIFDEKILRTFQTRHTQFLLFWFSSLSPEFTDHFTGNLIGRALDDQNTPTVTRVAAAGYVASFVSRAVSIDRVGARKVVSLLCTFLEDEMEELRFTNANMFNPGSTGTLNERIIKNSVVFYAACQATFYIFCFRWQDLLDENEEEIESLEGVPPTRRWMADLDILKMAVNSPLNPLRMCAPTVVSQFARMAHKTDFMYCHSIIEANKRQSRSRRNTVVESPTSEVDPLPTPTLARPGSLPRTLSTPASSLVESVLVQQALKDAQIDSHFPFDPYKLPLSASYIQGIYRNWDSGGLDDDDDEEDSDVDDSASAATETGEDSSMASSSIDNSFTDNTSSKMFPSGSLAIRGMIDPALLNSDDEDFSKSFDAMSVSPRRPPLMSSAY